MWITQISYSVLFPNILDHFHFLMRFRHYFKRSTAEKRSQSPLQPHFLIAGDTATQQTDPAMVEAAFCFSTLSPDPYFPSESSKDGSSSLPEH